MKTTPRYQAFDSELSVLSAVREAQDESERMTQRDLAKRAGISLGMANLILRRLAERGMLELTRLSAKRVRYALTGAGMKELARRTAGYYRRVSRSAGLYRDRLEALAAAAKRKGAEAIVLVGSSEVEYLLAEACERRGIIFLRTADPEKAESLARRNGAVLVLSENVEAAAHMDAGIPRESLADVLAARPADIAEGGAF
jgi:DNA-binding MarR family transcriptional regulator